MPPHCDSMDGPVVTAARRALDQGDIAIVLPYVPAQAEPEVTGAFQQVLPMHEAGGSADELVRVLTEVVADQTKTRLDRAMALKQHEHGSVAGAREYVEAMLGLQVWAHKRS
jgi:hypothetical protein